MNKCFPYKFVLRHTTDKPWITDNFRSLVRRQRAPMSGDLRQFQKMRNMVNRAAPKLRHDFFFYFFYLPSSNRITHSAESAVTNAGSWQQYTKYP